MKVISFNLRNWNRDKDKSFSTYWKTRLNSIVKMVKKENPDVLCLQEALPRMVRKIKRAGYKQVGFGISHVILIKKTIFAKNHHFRVFYEWCDIQGTRIINVHSRWETAIIKRVVAKISKLAEGRKAIACGDFNTSYAKLVNLGIGLIHARTELGLELKDTFMNFKNPSSHGEIDHFFINQITPKEFSIVTDNYGCERMSDHYPIILTI